MVAEKYPKLREEVRMSPLDLQLAEPAYLLLLPGGRPIRISSELFKILSLMNGRRSISQIARDASSLQERRISEKEVIWIIEKKLEPLGLLESQKSIGQIRHNAMETRRVKNLLTISPEKLRILTMSLHNLFMWLAVIILLPLIVVVHVWVFQGYSFSILRVSFLEMTGTDYFLGAILVFGCTLFHEVGHLAACQHYGGAPGELKVKLSSFVPTASANVTDSWRLSRLRRAAVDLGGLWFQLLCIPILYFLYAVTASYIPIFAIFWLDLGIVWVMIPTPRSDGYWFLLDLAGLPNLQDDNLRLLTADSVSRSKMRIGIVLILILGFATALLTMEAISISLPLGSDAIVRIIQSFNIASALDLLDGSVKLLVSTAILTGLVLINLRFVKCVIFAISRLGILLPRN